MQNKFGSNIIIEVDVNSNINTGEIVHNYSNGITATLFIYFGRID